MDDYRLGSSLSDRAMSAFPLSIGTSLAFESVFTAMQSPYDPSRTIPDHIDPTAYQTCWVNLRTLFRNLSSAVEKSVFLSASPEALADALESEVDVIQGLFAHEGQNLCKPIFYYSTYEKLLAQRIPGLEFRLPSTDGQKYFTAQLEATVKLLNKRSDSYHTLKDTIVPERREKAFVLTHYPYDLVGFDKFDRLDLLESNTGVVKPRSRWSSKYSSMSGQSFDHLPFFRKLLLVFGDKVLIKPMVAPMRKQILETSLARNWQPMTTLEKIKMDLGFDMKDPYMAAVFHAL